MGIQTYGVKILIVDSHSIMRQGIKSILQKSGCMFSFMEADSGFQAIPLIKREKPALVLLDFILNDISGIGLIRSINKSVSSSSKPKFLLFHTQVTLNDISQVIAAGGTGLLQKDTNYRELQNAIQYVLQGEFYFGSMFSQESIQAIVAKLKIHNARIKNSNDIVLSEREYQVLNYICKGLRSKDIAEKMNIGLRTVETYRARVLCKFACNSTPKLLAIIRENDRLTKSLSSGYSGYKEPELSPDKKHHGLFHPIRQ